MNEMSIKISLIVTLLITLFGINVYAKDLEFRDGVYRGEKWEFDFGKPKKNHEYC